MSNFLNKKHTHKKPPTFISWHRLPCRFALPVCSRPVYLGAAVACLCVRLGVKWPGPRLYGRRLPGNGPTQGGPGEKQRQTYLWYHNRGWIQLTLLHWIYFCFIDIMLLTILWYPNRIKLFPLRMDFTVFLIHNYDMCTVILWYPNRGRIELTALRIDLMFRYNAKKTMLCYHNRGSVKLAPLRFDLHTKC